MAAMDGVDRNFVRGRYSTYQLQEVLGHGGSSIVYKALDRCTNQHVAVKKMVAAEAHAAQWRAEVEMLLALRDDAVAAPYVIRYLDHMQAGKTIFIVEEMAEGGSLLTQLHAQGGGGFPERVAARLMWQVTKGLAYIHAQGIVHRDLKGANVLLCEHGTVKLADFGLSTASPLARTPDSEKATPTEESGGLLGSVYWMSPEIARGEPQTVRSDIWSLGCLALELLTGKPPFDDRTPFNALYKIADAKAPPIPPDLAISEDGQKFLHACLSCDPLARPTAASLVMAPWFADARVCAQLDALDTHEGEDAGHVPATPAGASASPRKPPVDDTLDVDLDAWVEGWFFSRPPDECEAWLQEGRLAQVVAVLPRVNPKVAFEVVRYFAYLAERGHEQKKLFINKLGETTLWDLPMKMAPPNFWEVVFSATCDGQCPHVARFAPSDPRALHNALSSTPEKEAQQAIAALHRLYVGRAPASGAVCTASPADVTAKDDGADSGGSSYLSSATGWEEAERRQQARQRLLADHGLLVLRGYVETVCRDAFASKQPPLVGWAAVDLLCEILRVMAATVPAAEPFLWGTESAVATGGAAVQAAEAAVEGALDAITTESLGFTRAWPHAVVRRATEGEDEAAAAEKLSGTARRPGLPWLLALQVASRQGGSTHAAYLLMHLLQNPMECFTDHVEAAGVGLAGVLLRLGSRPTLSIPLRVAVWRTLPLLKKASTKASVFLREDAGPIPFLAYTLKRCEAPEVRSALLACLLALCDDDRMAVTYASHPLVLPAAEEALCQAVAAAAADAASDDALRAATCVAGDVSLALQWLMLLVTKSPAPWAIRQVPESRVAVTLKDLATHSETASLAQQLLASVRDVTA